MKALSLTQPWATLVAIGAKRVETRSWRTSYRGPVAIHAAQGFPGWAQNECLGEPFMGRLMVAGFSHTRELPRGAMVAVAAISGVYRIPPDLWEPDPAAPDGFWERIVTTDEHDFGDYAPGRYAWQLTRVQALPQPVPCKGALGLWALPPDVYEQVKAACPEAPA